MHTITEIKAREILDSRGNPTVEVFLALSSGFSASASVPSGASTGSHEALELRDGDQKRYRGLGVLKAISHVNGEIRKLLLGRQHDQHSLDEELKKLDGTENKSRLGANAILGVSLSFARAAACADGVDLYKYIGSLTNTSDFSLPTPMCNIINGGKHADNGLSIQEFMIVPVGLDSMNRKIQAVKEITVALKKILMNKGMSTSMGDEGGFAPKLHSTEEAINFLLEAISNAGYDTSNVKIALDAAATSFYEKGVYTVRGSAQASLTSNDMLGWYDKLIKDYPIISIEDCFAEDDWDGFIAANKKMGGRVMIVGDDLTVTNSKRIKEAAEHRAINAVLIKTNQIGTLSETLEAIKTTKEKGFTPIISHRSGETLDTFIADLAVGTSAPFIKAGAPTKDERIAKYNRLLEIERLV